jgi:hypothetical protein
MREFMKIVESAEYDQWSPDRGIDDFVREEFSTGGCGYLALALHELTGWGIRAEIDVPRDQYERVGGGIEHIWVENPQYHAVDINGVHTSGFAQTKYSDPNNLGDVVKIDPDYLLHTSNDKEMMQWARDLVRLFPKHFGLKVNESIESGEGFSVSPESAKKILSSFYLQRGTKIGKNTRLWRGVSADSGSGMATYGTGFYFTADRKRAKIYGDVVEIDRSNLPLNPFRFNTNNDYEVWLYETGETLGYDDPRAFANAYQDVRFLVQAIDPYADGIQVMTGSDAMFVRYPTLNITENAPYEPGAMRNFMNILEGDMPQLYIRFGDLPEGGRSKIGAAPNWYKAQAQKDTHEAGISVLPVSFDDEMNRWAISANNYATLDALFHYKRPAYLVYGEHVTDEDGYDQYGMDDEPLLKNVKIIKQLQYDELWVPAWGKDPLPEEYLEAREDNLSETHEQIFELFGSPTSFRVIDPKIVPIQNVCAAYCFAVGETEYIVYMTREDEDDYVCSFGEVLWYNSEGRAKLSYDTDDQGSPFKVYSGVKNAFLSFIRDFEPETISFGGYNDKQNHLYRAILSKPKNLPPGYSFAGRVFDMLMIQRNTRA